MSSSPRPAKRRRTSGYISPVSLSPESEQNSGGTSTSTSAFLDRAVNVLRVEAEAVSAVATLYKDDETARTGLSDAVKAVLEAQDRGGKLVVCGVGKSAYIAMKLVATCKSLGVATSFLHAAEAIHGDLGDVREKDVLLFVSFSGKTPELLNLLPHVSPAVRLMALTSHTHKPDCQLLADRTSGILLPAPIQEKEESSFGVSAPTTSTTVALAVTDMFALTVASELHKGNSKDVFQRNHPGGAIGMTHREVEALKKSKVDVTIVELPSPSIAAESED